MWQVVSEGPILERSGLDSAPEISYQYAPYTVPR